MPLHALLLLSACHDAGAPVRAVDVDVALSAGPRSQIDPVTCSAVGDGADAWTYEWTVDGEPFTGLTLTTTHPGDTVFPGYTREGQVWTCTARAYAGGVQVGEATSETGIAAGSLEELDPWVAPDAWVEDGMACYRGPLAGGARVTLTWGVDGWAPRAGLVGGEQLQYPTNPFYQQAVTTMEAVDGAWCAAIAPPVTARAVHMVFDDGATVDDADGHQYTWDLTFPSVGPYLTWNDVATPTTGIVVNWASGQPGLGVVEYGPDKEHVAYATGKSVETLHHVTLGGLPAGQSFYYRVRDATGRMSDWSTFHVADPGDDTYTFLVASDMQDTGGPDERWAEIAAEMAAAVPDARYLVLPGDLAADDYPGLWWLFFDGGRDLFDHVPLVPAIGNHDGEEDTTSSWAWWFDLPEKPGGEAYWSVDYGRTRLYALDSEAPSQYAVDGAQYAWMEEATVDGNADVDWAIAAFHIPAYDAGGRFANTAIEYRPITQLFDGAVDVVLSGHEHIYQRFSPLRFDGTLAPSGEYGRDADDGVLYLVTPAAGFANLDQNMIAADAPGGEQRDLLAWPVLDDDGPGNSQHAHDEHEPNGNGVGLGKKDDEEEGDDEFDPTDNYGEEVDGVHGYLTAEVTPGALTFSFVGMGNSDEPAAAEVLDTVTIRR